MDGSIQRCMLFICAKHTETGVYTSKLLKQIPIGVNNGRWKQ